MSTNTQLTYYQRNKDIIFKKARDKYHKPEERIKKITYEKTNIIIWLKNKKIKEENMKKIEFVKKTEEENMQEIDIIWR